jgi:hypothetical protein
MTLLAVLAICCAGTARGQYQPSYQWGFDDNVANCANYNCFFVANKTPTGATANLKQISSGADGYTVGVDPNGSLWTLPMFVSGGSVAVTRAVGNQHGRGAVRK